MVVCLGPAFLDNGSSTLRLQTPSYQSSQESTSSSTRKNANAVHIISKSRFMQRAANIDWADEGNKNSSSAAENIWENHRFRWRQQSSTML
ncbi:hypothetical protein Tcan_18228 [Toxocara canis]|uniref:Uncharacterized protein n=1 Tax=Toxocara canis TaxID=6265 RepID=A0A0B2V5H0_TOXCA|nr:hypothetical protein Tcan_18228 [Toxocara canis]